MMSFEMLPGPSFFTLTPTPFPDWNQVPLTAALALGEATPRTSSAADTAMTSLKTPPWDCESARKRCDHPNCRLAGAVIAALLHPAAQVLDRGRVRIERHGRGLRDRVRLDTEHTGAPAEHLLDDRLLARVLQAADVQDDRVGSW